MKPTFLSELKSKQFEITVEGKGIVIDNTMLHSEEFSLTESICSEDQLVFGSCEASCVKFRVSGVAAPLKDEWITVSVTLIGADDSEEIYPVGRYRVYTDVPTADKTWRDITAYDALYDVINGDAASWYNGLTFPMTLKTFRDSFFAYFGIEQEETALINDAMTVEETISSTELSGKEVLAAICGINGAFGHINRAGKFEYVFLTSPGGGASSDQAPEPDVVVAAGTYLSCSYEDFTCEKISKLQIRQEENDIGVIVGDDTGREYVTEDNFLLYGKSTQELRPIAENMLNVISQAKYRPFEASVKGNLLMNAGDTIRIHTKDGEIDSYLLERSLSGIQALKDTISAKGTKEREQKVNGVQSKINQLRGKTNVLSRTIEETRSEISEKYTTKTDFQQQITELTSKISQESDNITLEFTGMVQDLENIVNNDRKQNLNEFTNIKNKNTEDINALNSSLTEKIDAERENMSSQINSLQDDMELIKDSNASLSEENLANLSELNNFKKYFRFTKDGLEIGEEGNELTLFMDNDHIIFMKNQEQVAWWDGQVLHTGDIEISVNQKAQFGIFSFVPRSDNSLMFLKTGG